MQILAGSYLGIRNPKAHSLNHDLDAEKAAQYLIFASLLARRIYEANAAPKAKVPRGLGGRGRCAGDPVRC